MAELIGRGLAKEGMAVDIAPTGEQAIDMAGTADYDSIVLDVMLPGIDGFETCRRLRAGAVWSPVIMLTALDSVQDRVTGLDTGADDYLVKPFAFAELLARLRAVARRREAERPSVLEVDDLRLDPASRRVWRGSVEVSLSAKEFAILETFMRRPTRRSPARTSSPTPGTARTRTARTSSTCTCAASAARSTSPSGGRRSRPSAARATGFAGTPRREPHPHPAAGGRGVRRGHGRRARGHRLVPLLQPRDAPRRTRSTGSCGCVHTTSRRSFGIPTRAWRRRPTAGSSRRARATPSS